MIGTMTAPATPWERVANTRWGTYVSKIERRAILRAHELAGPPSNALEVGCEGGRWSRLLSDLGWSMTCVDVNSNALTEVRRKIPDARCLLADPEDTTLDCETGSMSLLLCIEVAPVIFSDWFLSEARRVLTDGGILLSVVWNKSSLRGLVSRMSSESSRNSFYTRRYRDWKKELIDTGFESVNEEGLCWAPFGRASDSALIPLFTRVEALLGMRRIVRYSPWVVSIARKRA